MQGIKRVKSKSRTAALGGGREGGYSQKEVFLSFSLLDQFLLVSTFASNFLDQVWNWLYLEEDGGAVEGEEDAGGQPLEHPRPALTSPALTSLALLSACVPLRGRGVRHRGPGEAAGERLVRVGLLAVLLRHHGAFNSDLGSRVSKNVSNNILPLNYLFLSNHGTDGTLF